MTVILSNMTGTFITVAATCHFLAVTKTKMPALGNSMTATLVTSTVIYTKMTVF